MSSTTTKNPDQTSSSVSAFLSTLVPVAAEAILFVGVFLILRTKYKRVYHPRTYLATLRDEEKSKELPEGRFSWLQSFRSLSDEYVLNHQSLDGYLYLRFLKMLAFMCFVGACITWPVLFPVNATGDGGQSQFDILSFSNIGGDQKNRYYAHVFVGWVFFIFVMWLITRETIYFINLRHAYLLAPFNAARISSRTVLFTDVPGEFQNVEKLQSLFGGAMRRCWLATDCNELEDVVEERDKDALKLEGAEIKLIQTANKRRLKWEKKNEKKKTAAADAADAEPALPGSQWMKKKDRPTHRLGIWKIPFLGKKVDTIDWSRSELKRLNPEVEKNQIKHQHFEWKLLPSVFVEFNTQQAAEATFRRMTPRKSPKMYPRAISVVPSEVIWSNLKIRKTMRKLRKFGTSTFLTLMIIFWAIPVAVVGAISNINYLTNKVPFLSFIDKIPPVILGLVTGLLPSILLSVLMALVPIVCRLMAKLGGEVTLPGVELVTQDWYMAFQVIQVFVITTFSSGAASVVTEIINDPSSATTLLAENLPKASNFFISYIIVQGLGLAASDLLNIGAFVMLNIVGKFLDKSPRKIFKRYIKLAGLGWGSLYPKIGNLGIIAISYSIISPLLLGFATLGFFFLYLAFRYNSIFVLTNNVDTKGRAYAKALQQLMTGVYLSEVCLIGLFAINTAPGPIVLMAVFLVATVVYHALMRHALKPLMEYLPETYDGKEEPGLNLFSKADTKSYDASKANGPPTEAAPLASKKLAAKKADFFGRLFDPRKFKSHGSVGALVPDYPPPQYEEEDAKMAYYNPVVYRECPRLWIVRDEMGLSRREVQESGEVVEISDEGAVLSEKNKVVWISPEQEGVEGAVRLEDVPVWEKRVDY